MASPVSVLDIRSLTFAIAFGLALARATELLQAGLTYRTIELLDFLAGRGDSLAGAWAARAFNRRFRGPLAGASRQ
jgi:rRNA processing protein Krr1/Pno1